MKKSKGETLQNTALLDALSERKWSVEQGALFLGVATPVLKRWLNYTGRPPKITPELAIRIKELTGRLAEDVLPPEFFAMGKVRPSARETKMLPLPLLQNLVGGYYLFQNPVQDLERHQEATAIIDILRNFSLEENQVMQALMEGTPDEELAEAMSISVAQVRVTRSRTIDAIRRKVFNLKGSIH